MGTQRYSTLSGEKLRLGQIGIGYWEPNRLRVLVGHDRCEMRRVTDPSPKHRAYVQQLFADVKVGTDPTEILGDKEIDAVVIATHTSDHGELALEALRAGKHVLVEKPLANTLEELDKIVAESRARGLVAMVGHSYVYSPAVRALRRLINDGELGQVRYIYSQRLNLGRIRQDLDALWNFAPHDLSIIQHIFGDPVPFGVHRFGMDYVQRGIDDVVFLTVQYPNKVIAHIHVSWLDPQSVRRMVIVGSEKMAIYDDTAEKKIVIYDRGIDRMALMEGDHDNPAAWAFGHRTGSGIALEIEKEDPLREEFLHFYDCVKNGTECTTGPEHAARVLKILLLAGTKKPSLLQVDTSRASTGATSPPNPPAQESASAKGKPPLGNDKVAEANLNGAAEEEEKAPTT